jgi:aquaporin Z
MRLDHDRTPEELAMNARLSKAIGAEFLGTFWLVFGGCGTAVFAAMFVKGDTDTGLGVGFLGVAIAFGLTVLTMAYAVGHISGGHFNPAVTLGLCMARRFPWTDAIAYIITQVVAGLAAGALLLGVANGKPGFSTKVSGLAANGYGIHSPGHYSLAACFIIEVLLTGFFLYVIVGVTDSRALNQFAPIAIGLALTLIHLISIPITNTSVNPARSTGVAFFAGHGAAGQLWLFWVAPILGALIAGATYRMIIGEPDQEEFANA